ncbi:MAG: hypothetical protein ACREHD_19570 [Pirellulales bacterium]
MTPIATLVATILAAPAPVLVFDTCSLLDLFRRDSTRQQPRVPPDEIQAAAHVLQSLAAQPKALHLVVPELVPGEYRDHADRIEGEFEGWFLSHDENRQWLAEAARSLALALPAQLAVHPFGIHAVCRKLAEDLLANAVVLARDQSCLDRAVDRLVAKRRPSHKKEIKDSMNLEQSLELSRQLQSAGFTAARVFVSSNTNDFAASAESSAAHPELQGEFAAVGLEYFTSLRSAVGSLRSRGELP